MKWNLFSRKEDLDEGLYCWYKKLDEEIYHLVYFFDDCGDGQTIIDIEIINFNDKSINWEEADAMYSRTISLKTDVYGLEKASGLSMIFGAEKFGARHEYSNNKNKAIQILVDNGIETECIK